MKMLNRAAISFLLLLCSISVYSQVRLPDLVSDGMVLQRNTKINVWGWASPGEKVRICFTGKKYSAITGTDGKWLIVLPPIKAGGPYTMDIAASNRITIKDILIGDVWFCSGQSNMVLPMERVKEKYPADIANASYPDIRNFFVPTLSDVTKIHNDLPPGKWIPATSKNVLEFGAASYFFAEKIYRKYHVPIGIINSSVGGTPVEAWISEDGLKQFSQYENKLIKFKDTAYTSSLVKTSMAAHSAANSIITKIPDAGLTGSKPWYDTTYIPAGWHHFWLPGYWADQGIRGLNGTVWFRKEIEVPTSMTGKPARLFMGRIVDADYVYVNGVFSGSTSYQYPPRRYDLPAGLLKPGKNIIVIKVVNTAGKGGFVPDKPYFITTATQQLDLRGDWQYKVGQVFPPAKSYSEFSMQNEPSGLYNTMVAPAVNYTVKGFIWYQGEANTNRPKEYRKLLTALIADWRNKWRQGDIPFLFVQLPNFMETQYSPAESQWAELREQQLQTLVVPNTAMAVAIDAGEWNDIHPLDKKNVGYRLALAAENIAYGDKNVVYSGPVYQSYKIEGNTIVITFDNTGGGLGTKDGEELHYFAIAGADKKYVWAKAIIEGDKVIVWNDDLANPVSVRYAWADNPEGANLCNKVGLPASPFETDPE